jgi:integrase
LALIETLWTLRRHEVAQLCWGDLDLPRGLVYVKRGKGDKPATTLLPGPTRAALAAWYVAAGTPSDETPVFPIPPKPGCQGFVGGPYTAAGLGGVVQRILLRAGLWTRGIGCSHRFRRSFASQYLRQNRHDLVGLATLLRHSDVATTTRYCYLELEDLTPQMAALEL